MNWRWAPWLVVIASLFVAPGRGHGQGRRKPALHWSRDDGARECIDPRLLAERVEQLTGPVFVSPSEADMSIEAHIERKPKGGFRARIAVTRITGAQAGERELAFTGVNCRDFDDALTFVIALTIDPDLDLESVQRALGPMDTEPEQALLQELEASTQETVPAQDPLATPVVSPDEPKPVPPPIEEQTTKEPRFCLGGSVIIAGRELPRASVGAALELAWLMRDFLTVAWWTRGSVAVDELQLQGERSLRAQALSSSLLVCPRLAKVERLRLDLCIGPELGAQRARGLGLMQSVTASLMTYGGLARLGLSWSPARSLRLDAQGFLSLNATDKRFVYDIPGQTLEAYRLSRWGAGVALGVSREF